MAIGDGTKRQRQARVTDKEHVLPINNTRVKDNREVRTKKPFSALTG